MDCKKREDTTPLLIATAAPSLKFPLGLVSPTMRPYLELIRIEKPTGVVLMFWPFAWGLTMGAYRVGVPIQVYGINLLKCMVSAFILRCSACTVNDIFDRNLDANVERCRTRPLPSGRISVLASIIYLVLQYVIGLVFFYSAYRGLSLWVAWFQLLPLFMLYPLFKRFTHWPQAWLGLAMNSGLITAWIATTGFLDFGVLSAGMFGCWCWTMLYDTIYACQDIKDDIRAGVRSTAILFGRWIRPLLVCCGVTFVAMLALVGYLNNQGQMYLIISVGGTAVHLIWQYNTVNLEVPKSCWQNFKSNGQLGWIVWGGLMVDYLHSMGSI